MISIQHPNGGYDKLNLGEGRTQADGGLNDIVSNNVPIRIYSAIDQLDWKYYWRGSWEPFDSAQAQRSACKRRSPGIY